MIRRLHSHSSAVRHLTSVYHHVFFPDYNLFISFAAIADDGHDRPTPREGKPPLPQSEFKCLIRAQSKSKKLSTVVNQNEIMKFMEAYGKVMKTSIVSSFSTQPKKFKS